MAISLLNNISSMVAQNQLAMTGANLAQTLSRLSSGSRINSGADDAAGLAIADGLHANTTALQQSARNANDGIGSLQVADGSLAQVTTLLNRAVTLATESANGTVSDQQRTALNGEFSKIMTEINNIGNNTTFNGSAVFSGTSLDTYMSDANTPTTISVTTGALSAASLNLGTAATASFSLVGSPADNDSVTVGGKTYTFKTSVGATANQVLIGSDVNSTWKNLKAAINGDASMSGLTFGSATVANANVTATSANGSAIVVQANTSGTGGNAIVASEHLTNGGGWANEPSQLTFTGNATVGDTVSVGGQVYTLQDAGHMASANDVLIGASSNATLANLKKAITGTGAGDDSDYHAGTGAVTGATTGNVTVDTVAHSISLAIVPGVAVAASLTTGDAWGAGPTTLSGGTGSAVDLSSASHAQSALAAINSAVANVAGTRGTIGAGINQLQAAVNVMQNQVQNLTNAENGIRSADIGAEVANMSRYQILTQTGIAALAQANSSQQAVLKLLQ